LLFYRKLLETTNIIIGGTVLKEPECLGKAKGYGLGDRDSIPGISKIFSITLRDRDQWSSTWGMRTPGSKISYGVRENILRGM
jgi:hypothetical protein